MKIKTTTTLKDLNKQELKASGEVFTVGKTLANIIASHEVGGKMKLWVLAQDFYNKKEVELDAADLALVKEAIEKTKVYTSVIITGQLLEILESNK